jgi:hypothetical protein
LADGSAFPDLFRLPALVLYIIIVSEVRRIGAGYRAGVTLASSPRHAADARGLALRNRAFVAAAQPWRTPGASCS